MIPPQRRRTRSRHFHVTAREMLLELPHRCPYLPGLALLGVAVTATEQHHIVLELGSSTSADRFYLGPTQEQVQQRARILGAALQELPDVDAFHASLVQEWVLLTWESLLDEIVEQVVDASL